MLHCMSFVIHGHNVNHGYSNISLHANKSCSTVIMSNGIYELNYSYSAKWLLASLEF